MEPSYFQGVNKFKGFSSFFLKILAITTMLIDHSAAVFLGGGFSVFRLIGRIAFPIFAFMIAEGARRTHSIEKYSLRLVIFAFISEIPFDLALMNGQLLEFTHQNVFFTLALGLLSIWGLQRLENTKFRFLSPLILLLCMSIAFFIDSDYNAMGVLCVYLFYIFADKKPCLRIPGFILACAVPAVTIISLSVYLPELYALFALIPIFFYNGEKGRQINKFVFYAFYPAHLLLLSIIKLIIN